MQRTIKPTKRVTVVVSKQQNKQNKSRSNTRKGSAKVRRQSDINIPMNIYAPNAIGLPKKTDNRMDNFSFPRREFVQSVSGSSGFSCQSLKLNPGDRTCFPWGSRIAPNFESYRFKKVSLEYVPRCPSTTPGLVAIVPDMNPKDKPPQTIERALQNQQSINDCSWKNIKVSLTKEMLSKRSSYYCRPLADDADIDLYDCGNIHIITQGQSDTSVIGQLWINYEVVFMTPESQNEDVPTTLITGNVGDGVSRLNPVPNASNARDQTGDVIAEIYGDGTGSVLKFAKDFHGFLTTTGTADANLTSNAWSYTSLDPAKPVSANLNEAFGTIGKVFNGNIQMKEATSFSTNTLMRAVAGSLMRMSWNPAQNPTNVAISLASCGL